MHIYMYIYVYQTYHVLSHLGLNVKSTTNTGPSRVIIFCQGSHAVLATEGAVLVASPSFPHQSVRTQPAQTREHQDLELIEALIDESGTPWKINMKPTHHPFRKENDLPNLHDYAPC